MIVDTYGKENIEKLLYTLSNIKRLSERLIDILTPMLIQGHHQDKYVNDLKTRKSILRNIQVIGSGNETEISIFVATNLSWVVTSILLLDIKEIPLYVSSRYPVVRKVAEWRLKLGL